MPDTLRTTPKYLAWISLLLAAVTAILLAMGYRSQVGPLVIGALTLLALYFMRHPFLKSYAFTVWVFAFVGGSMFYPQAFMKWAGYDLGKLIVPLIQIIMFGMGTTLSLADFARVFKMPWPVFVGAILQFSVMPLVGFAIASTFGFSPEIAAGIVLVGSVSGGVASNVMTFLANGDIALSVTMTAFSTLLSPAMTPFLMKMLAGRFIPIKFLPMMISILDMTIVPIVAGLIANRILYSNSPWTHRKGPLALVAVLGFGVAALTVVLQDSLPGPILAVKNGIIIGTILIGAVAMTRLVVSILLNRSDNWMDRVLPVVSMAGICLIIAIITARSRDALLSVGGLLMVAVILHNSTGYLLGYWLSRLLRLNERTCRTVAIEVGMQNGGMASALAMNVLKSAEAAVAPAIFGPYMNVSGSILATWWHRKPIREAPSKDRAISEAKQQGAFDGST